MKYFVAYNNTSHRPIHQLLIKKSLKIIPYDKVGNKNSRNLYLTLLTLTKNYLDSLDNFFSCHNTVDFL